LEKLKQVDAENEEIAAQIHLLNKKISDNQTDVSSSESVENDIRAFIKKYKINCDIRPKKMALKSV
jgi:hypothetical protein